MEQTFNGLVVAVNTTTEIIKPADFERVPETYVLAIEAFDSGEWLADLKDASTLRSSAQRWW
ncbi:hypothetical protein QNM99_05335 [Pseudomonas sp. PCH446]